MNDAINHLRSKWYKYLIETFFIVISVLIAFAFDDWRESVNKKNLVHAYAMSLVTDLHDDINDIEVIRNQIDEYILRIDSLANYSRNKTLDQFSNLTLFPLTLGDLMYKPYSWHQTTINDLESSGALRFEGNEILSKKIGAYVAFVNHMNEDYQIDLNLKETISEYANNVVNLNYSNFEELSYYGNTNTQILSSDFAISKAYKTAQEDNLSLLTNDINDVHKLVNGYLRLRLFLKIRNGELTRLITRAEEIIKLLETNYIIID